MSRKKETDEERSARFQSAVKLKDAACALEAILGFPVGDDVPLGEQIMLDPVDLRVSLPQKHVYTILELLAQKKDFNHVFEGVKNRNNR